MKYIIVIFIFDKQGKIYLTNINEFAWCIIFHEYISESDTHDINNKIRYLLKTRIDLKYKISRLFEIAIDESKEKEYKYYLYCYRIKKFNNDYMFGKEIVELKDIYKKYDELHNDMIKMIYDKFNNIMLTISRNSYLIKRLKESWKSNTLGFKGPVWFDPVKVGFDSRLDISR